MRLAQDLYPLPLKELARVVADCPVVAAQQVVFCVDELDRNIRLWQATIYPICRAMHTHCMAGK